MNLSLATSSCAYTKPVLPRQTIKGKRGRPRYKEPSKRRGCTIEESLDQLLEQDRKELGISRTDQYRFALYLYAFHRNGGLSFLTPKNQKSLKKEKKFLEEESNDCSQSIKTDSSRQAKLPGVSQKPILKEVTQVSESPVRKKENTCIPTEPKETSVLLASKGLILSQENCNTREAFPKEAPPLSSSSFKNNEDAYDNWLEDMAKKHNVNKKEAKMPLFANYPHVRFVECSEEDCHKKAGKTIDGKDYCTECGNFLEEMRRRKTPRLLAVLPPFATPKSCFQCKNRRILLTEKEGKLSAVLCNACETKCPRCQGSGVFYNETRQYAAWDPCACGKEYTKRWITHLDFAHIPDVYRNILLGKLPHFLLTKSQKDAQQMSFDWFKALKEAKAKKEKTGFLPTNGLFYYGPPGTGKTLSLCRTLALLCQLGIRCKYIHFPQYLNNRKALFEGKEIEEEAVGELTQIDVLVVDEILMGDRRGKKRRFTDWERSQFDLLVHGRWNQQKPTLYATNYTPKEIEDEVAESTWSRIRSTSSFLHVIGADLRRYR